MELITVAVFAPLYGAVLGVVIVQLCHPGRICRSTEKFFRFKAERGPHKPSVGKLRFEISGKKVRV
jgi:hypothetical protein